MHILHLSCRDAYLTSLLQGTFANVDSYRSFGARNEKKSSAQVIASSFSGTSLMMVPCYSVENGLTTEIKELCTDIEEACIL